MNDTAILETLRLLNTSGDRVVVKATLINGNVVELAAPASTMSAADAIVAVETTAKLGLVERFSVDRVER